MKKLLLSGLVVLIFIAYVYHQRHENSVAIQTVQHPISGKTAASSNPAATNSAAPAATQPPPTSSNSPTISPQSSQGAFKNGTYTGDVIDAFYGNVQVQVVISGGKISGVNFLQYPNESRTSRAINSQATPMLAQEAVSAQSAKVDIITGATSTSSAFIQSLTAALAHAS